VMTHAALFAVIRWYLSLLPPYESQMSEPGGHHHHQKRILSNMIGHLALNDSIDTSILLLFAPELVQGDVLIRLMRRPDSWRTVLASLESARPYRDICPSTFDAIAALS